MSGEVKVGGSGGRRWRWGGEWDWDWEWQCEWAAGAGDGGREEGSLTLRSEEALRLRRGLEPERV